MSSAGEGRPSNGCKPAIVRKARSNSVTARSSEALIPSVLQIDRSLGTTSTKKRAPFGARWKICRIAPACTDFFLERVADGARDDPRIFTGGNCTRRATERGLRKEV